MSDSTAEHSRPAATHLTANAGSHPLKRRGLLIGAGAAGAVVLVAKALPGAAPVATTAALTAKQVVDPSGGYRVTDHVLRYYETTRA